MTQGRPNGPPCAIFRRTWKNRPADEYEQFFVPVSYRPDDPIPILDPISYIVNPLEPSTSNTTISTSEDLAGFSELSVH